MHETANHQQPISDMTEDRLAKKLCVTLTCMNRSLL